MICYSTHHKYNYRTFRGKAKILKNRLKNRSNLVHRWIDKNLYGWIDVDEYIMDGREGVGGKREREKKNERERKDREA